MEELELGIPVGKQGPAYTAFEDWIDGFPLLPLAGSVKTRRASTHYSSFYSKRCFLINSLVCSGDISGNLYFFRVRALFLYTVPVPG